MDILLNADRERTSLTFVLALLVNGRTILADFSWAKGGEKFANALKEFGLLYEMKGHELVLEGKGFLYEFPSLLPVDFSEADLVLLYTLSSKNTEQIYTLAVEEREKDLFENAKKILQKHFKIKINTEKECKITFNFLHQNYIPKKNSLGNIPTIERNKMLLYALLQGEFISFEEKAPVHDQFTKMLLYFGVKIKYESRGVEQLSEFERRLMIAQGKKVERTLLTEMAETKTITGRDYFIPGDTTESLAFILLMLAYNTSKNKSFILKNVDLNSSRAGGITALKRMGANLENTSRREKYGDVFGDIEVFALDPDKRLQGRRFSEEVIATAFEDYPFLTVAACFADGETILRVPKEERETMRQFNDLLAENLRKTGAEVGVYDEGLVIRGLENIENGSDFDGGEYPAMNLALSILSLVLEDEPTIKNAPLIEENYPGILEKLKRALEELKTENSES